MKKITVQCHSCGELVEIEDKGFYWAICSKCSNELYESLSNDFKKREKVNTVYK